MTKEEFTLHLIRSLILEYRLSLETISELGLTQNINDIYNKITNINDLTINGALKYVLDYESKGSLVDQKEAKKQAIKFLISFRKSNDIKERIHMINQLNNNFEINSLKNKNGRMNENDIIAILKYRHKYCLAKKETAKIFNIAHKSLDYWENNLCDETLKNKLKALNDFKRITEYSGFKTRKHI